MDSPRRYSSDVTSHRLSRQFRPAMVPATVTRTERRRALVAPCTVVNPDTVQAQIRAELSLAPPPPSIGEITLKNGRVEQTNLDTYQMLRMNEAPAFEVHIVQSAELRAAFKCQ